MTVFLRRVAVASLVLVGACSDNDDQNGNNGVVGVTPGTATGSGSGSGSSTAAAFHTVALVADTADAKALRVDPDVVNAWGVIAHDGAMVIANNGTGAVSMFDGLGKPVTGDGILLEPGIDGVAANGDHAIQVHDASGNCGVAELIVASETGKLWGVNPRILPSSGEVLVDRSDANAIYKGVAVVHASAGTRVLAADFHNGVIEVFDDSMHLVDSSKLFVDPNVKPGFAPFNVVEIGTQVYVMYAMQDDAKEDEVAGAGLGAIGVFDVDGTFVAELAAGGLLDAPWGLALSPVEFSPILGSALIVGNFGDGTMLAIQPGSGKVIGQLGDSAGKPLVIDGLWGLAFATAADQVPGAVPGWMYFGAGPDDESHGLFGYVTSD